MLFKGGSVLFFGGILVSSVVWVFLISLINITLVAGKDYGGEGLGKERFRYFFAFEAISPHPVVGISVSLRVWIICYS